MAISPSQPCFSPAFSRSLSEFLDRPSDKDILFQRSGKSVIRPKKTTMPPEIYFQTIGSIPIKTVETLSSSVKAIIEKAKAKVILKGFHLALPYTELPIMIGNRGRTQGARTVKSPDIYEVMRSESIGELNCYLPNKILCGIIKIVNSKTKLKYIKYYVRNY